MQNISREDEFDSHDIELVTATHFHVNRFTQRLVLIQRPETTRKWLTKFIMHNSVNNIIELK